MKRIPEGAKHKKISIPTKVECYLSVGDKKLDVRWNIEEHHYVRALVNLKNDIVNKSGFA